MKSASHPEVIVLDPATAAEFLTRNRTNRPFKHRWIPVLAQRMLDGSWIEAASDPIRFDIHGNLIDGQNRCAAVVQAEATILATVVRDLPEEAFAVLGEQMPRTAADTLSVMQVDDPHAVASTVRWAWIVDRSFRTNFGPQKQQLAAFVREHPHVAEPISIAGDVRRAWPRAFSRYLHWVTNGEARRFLEHSALPTGVPTRNPAVAMHRTLLADRVRVGRRLPYEMLMLAIKACHAYMAGRDLLTLKLLRDDDGSVLRPVMPPEFFPRYGLTKPYAAVPIPSKLEKRGAGKTSSWRRQRLGAPEKGAPLE